MKPQTGTTITYVFILVFFAYIFLFMGIGSYSLKEPDEGRYAEIPREMVESGDYTVPRLNDVRYFEKPPMLYWTVALSYKIFGVSQWAFRFPNALAAALCVFSLFFFVRKWADDHAALLGSLVLLSSFGFFATARIVTTDMLFTSWLFVALLCFYEYYRKKSGFFIYGFYGAAAIATLTKGPVAPVLLCLAILVFLLTEGNIRFLRNMKIIQGCLVYLAITTPWFIVISIREKEFFHFFFIDQHVLRFLSKKHKRTGPAYYFIPVLLGGMLPWSFFIPRACLSIWRRPECRLFLIWSVIVFAFFSLSGSKLPPYILPIFPTMAILVAVLFHDRKTGTFHRPWEITVLQVFLAVLALSSFLFMVTPFVRYISRISMDALSIMNDLRYLSLWVSSSAAICCILFFVKHFRRAHCVFILLFLFSLSTIIAIMSHSSVNERINTTKELALAIKREPNPPDVIINYSALDLTLPFYLGQPVVIASYTGELEMGAKYNDAGKTFLDEAGFFRLMGSNQKIMVVTKVKRVKNLERSFPGRLKIRLCQNDRCLLSNY